MDENSNLMDILKTTKLMALEETLPDKAFRRNSKVYPLVSTVNHITACVVSDNYAPVNNLIERANSYLSEFHPSNTKDKAYVNLVSNYLTEVKMHIEANGI